MSITQEYEQFKNEVGAAEWARINEFLESRQDLYLSDLLYSRSVWEQFEQWKGEQIK